MLPPNTLQGQVAIITGGGTGLGRAMALEYSSLGAKLVLASRSLEHLEPTVAEIRKAGGEAIGDQAHQEDHGELQALCLVHGEHLHCVRVLVGFHRLRVVSAVDEMKYTMKGTIISP